MSLRIRRGTDAQRSTITFDLGEIIWVTDTAKLYVGDGITQGAKSIIEHYAGTGLAYDVDNDELKLDTLTLTTDDITQGSTNLYFSTTAAQNSTAELFANGTHTNISYIYDNNPLSPKINSTVTISPETVQDLVAPMFLNGTHSGVTFTYTDNGLSNGVINANVTVDPEDVQDAVETLINNGTQSGIVVSYDDLTDSLSFEIDDTYINNLIFTSTGGIELIQDAVATLINSGTHTGIDITYDDNPLVGPASISFDVIPFTVASDTAPFLGGNLDLDSFDIMGNGNIDILGDITAAGIIEMGSGSILEGSLVSGNIIKLKGNHTSVFCPTDGTIAEPGWLDISSHKGTYDLPVNLVANDTGSAILFRSYFDDDYQFNAAIIATLDSDAAVNLDVIPGVPAKISVKVKNNKPTGISSYDFNSDGVFVAPGAIQPGVYANSTARDAALPYATPGTIVFLTDGTGTGTPQFHGCTVAYSGTYGDPGYTAPIWVSLN